MHNARPPEHPKKNCPQSKRERPNLILEAKIRELEEAVIEARLKNDVPAYDLFHRELVLHLLDLYAAIGTNKRTRKPNSGE